MGLDKIMVIRQQKIIDELKAEITYLKETSEYWEEKYLNLLNKTVDK